MKKLISLLLVAALLTGCGAETESAKDSSTNETSGTDTSSAETDYDPFAKSDSGSASETFGYSYGVDWKDGKAYVLDYAPTVSFDYFVENDSGDKTVDFGLLLFVNGICQPYRIGADTENKAMHIFKVNGSEKKTQTISFEAVTGEQGEELLVEVVSMLQPDYVQETNAEYNFHHKISSLLPSKLLVTEKTKKTDPKVCTDYVTEQISEELRQKFGTMRANGGAGENQLDTTTTIEALKNGVLITPADRLKAEPDLTSFQVSDDVELCMYGGKTPCKYRVSMYVNHELVQGAFDGADYIDMTASRDAISRKKIVLSELGLTLHEWNHLYFVAVPFYTNDNFEERMVLKSRSVTLAGR